MGSEKTNIEKAAEVVDTAKNIASPILKVKSATAKTSIMRLTKDQIFQFPLIMDADINDDEKFPIIKSIEKNYAALIMTAITNAGVIDRDKYEDTNKFLRRFHNNSDIPFDALESGICIDQAVACEGYLPKNELIDMWDCVEEQLDAESINDMYLPYQRTAAKLTRAVEAARLSIANEADESTEKLFRVLDYKKDKDGSPVKTGGSFVVNTDKDGAPAYQYLSASKVSNYDAMVAKYGEPKSAAEWKALNSDDKASLEREKTAARRDEAAVKQLVEAKSRISGEMVKDEKFNSLTPTILKLTLANIRNGAGAPWSQELIVGVRAMPRLLPQSIMISNMVESFKDRAVFKFIKWSRGEIKWSDIFFGINAAREDASMKADRKWLKILKNRAKKDKLFRTIGMGHKLNPNATVIITEADAHLIQEKCGVNPMDISNVRKMMDKYFLLGFGIYDTEGKMLSIIYDGETEFSNYSMRSMVADAKREANLLSMGKY